MRSGVGAICILVLAVREFVPGFLCDVFDMDDVFDAEPGFDVELDFTGVTLFFVCEVLCGFRDAVDFVSVDFVANAGIAE
jgi:hypothetical protein